MLYSPDGKLPGRGSDIHPAVRGRRFPQITVKNVLDGEKLASPRRSAHSTTEPQRFSQHRPRANKD